jgi:hypothetical protein
MRHSKDMHFLTDSLINSVPFKIAVSLPIGLEEAPFLYLLLGIVVTFL